MRKFDSFFFLFTKTKVRIERSRLPLSYAYRDTREQRQNSVTDRGASRISHDHAALLICMIGHNRVREDRFLRGILHNVRTYAAGADVAGPCHRINRETPPISRYAANYNDVKLETAAWHVDACTIVVDLSRILLWSCPRQIYGGLDVIDIFFQPTIHVTLSCADWTPRNAAEGETAVKFETRYFGRNNRNERTYWRNSP